MTYDLCRDAHRGIDCCNTGQSDEAEYKPDIFNGLSPAQEYDQHIKKRNEARDKFGEIE